MRPARPLLTAALAAAATGALQRAATRAPARVAGALARTNHRGEPVTLAEGPVTALGATLSAVLGASALSGRTAVAAGVAGLGAAVVGAYDDVVGARPEQRTDKGFRGHLNALREGRVSAGAVKVAGVGLSALAAGAVLPGAPGRSARGGALDAALAATVIAGAANVVNLFDLRPGRALKVSLLAAAPLLVTDRNGAAVIASAVTGAAVAALPDDLGERSMLGDAGANALGALLGVAAAARLGRTGRALTAAGLIGLMAASEKVSFTAVIARTPALNSIDLWGRRPPAPAVRTPGPAEPVDVPQPLGSAEPVDVPEPGPGAGAR